MSPPLLYYLPYLGLTLAVEVPIVVLLLRRRCGWLHSMGGAVVASGTTNPALWYLWPLVVSPYRQYVAYAATGELLVLAIETVILFGLVVRRGEWSSRARAWAVAFGVSLLANATSFGSGMLLWALG